MTMPGDGCPEVGGSRLDKPADSNGSLNIGAGENPLDGYYNIDIDPKVPGVYKGDAADLSGIKTGSQSRINIDNPYGYDPLNSEILRVLSPGGKIVMTGNAQSNGYMKRALRRVGELSLEIVSSRQVSSEGYKLVDGGKMTGKVLTEVTLERGK